MRELVFKQTFVLRDVVHTLAKQIAQPSREPRNPRHIRGAAFKAVRQQRGLMQLPRQAARPPLHERPFQLFGTNKQHSRTLWAKQPLVPGHADGGSTFQPSGVNLYRTCRLGSIHNHWHPCICEQIIKRFQRDHAAEYI